MKGAVDAAEAALAALEAGGATPDLIALTHLLQAYAVQRDVPGATVRAGSCWGVWIPGSQGHIDRPTDRPIE